MLPRDPCHPGVNYGVSRACVFPSVLIISSFAVLFGVEGESREEGMVVRGEGGEGRRGWFGGLGRQSEPGVGYGAVGGDPNVREFITARVGAGGQCVCHPGNIVQWRRPAITLGTNYGSVLVECLPLRPWGMGLTLLHSYDTKAIVWCIAQSAALRQSGFNWWQGVRHQHFFW